MKKLIFALMAFWPICVVAQTAVIPYRSPRVTFTTSTGQPLSGGCIFTYQGGTTTQQATYTDYTGSTPNSNPVILDSTGSAVMWLGTNSYKFVAYSAGGTNCASGSIQWTVDNVTGNSFNGSLSGVTITNPTITGGTESGTAISGDTIATSNIQSTPIGTTTPAAGSFTAISGAVDSLSFSGTPVFVASSYSTFLFTLTGNVSSSTITGGVTGQVIYFNVCQNATGGYTFAWPASFVNAPTIPSQPSGCMTPAFFFDGASWQYIDFLAATSSAAYQTVTWSATPTFAVNPYYIFALTLTGNVTSSTVTGATTGQIISFYLCQDATGGRGFVWPGTFSTYPNMPQAANACITPRFLYNGSAWVLLNQNHPTSLQTVTWSATPAFNASGYNQFSITLGGNVTSSTISGGYFGQLSSFSICQNATGGYTFVWPTNVLNAPTIASTASACTSTIAIYDGTNWNTVPTSANPGWTTAGSSTSYWHQDPTGWLTECGYVADLGSGDYTLTYPKAFTTQVVPVVVSVYASGTGVWLIVNSGSMSLTGFSVHQAEEVHQGMNWCANGY